MANAGLPSNTINVLLQDGSGSIWAGTDWGLCRYDGSQWQVIQAAEGGLPENDITALAVDSADRLWVGTSLNGIAIYDGVTWEYLTIDNSDLPDNTIHGITHDLRGWTWIGTSLGLACITDQGWRIYDNTPESFMGFEFFSPNVRGITVTADTLVCVATMNGGLTYLTETDFIYYTTFNSAFFDNTSNAIVTDSNGDRWIASAASGLIRHAGPYDGGPWFNYSAQNSGFPDNTITSLVIDEEDTKFCGTEIGGIIVVPADGFWSVYNMANSGLPDDRVLSLMRDDQGTLWAGTYSGGVAKFSGPTNVDRPAPYGNDIRVFPTVFDRSITILSRSEPFDHLWEIFDAGGRSVLHGTLFGDTRAALELHGLAPGLHVLIVSHGGHHQAIRIMKLEP